MKDLILYLSAIVVIAPLAKKFGLGSVVGYLIAGVLIGPEGFQLLSSSPEDAAHLAEFGIMMMLLMIGLELNPSVLWQMRGPIFGLGSAQVLGTSLVLAGVSMFMMGLSINQAIFVGLSLSISSTAIVVQTLKEKGYLKSLAGERAFAVLLFQDIAVIPMLALIPFLSESAKSGGEISQSSPSLTAIKIILAVLLLILVGRYGLRPVFNLISKLKIRETFTALALLIVLLSSSLMHLVGLSPALGCFLAGVMLANSEYKHQIEADLDPFKGLLLGLFFMTVGSGLSIVAVMNAPLQTALWILLLIPIKLVALFILARSFRIPTPESLLFSTSLAHGGEFAFVLLAQSEGILSLDQAQIMKAAIMISMSLSPVLISAMIRFGMTRFQCLTESQKSEREADVIDEKSKENPVIVIGIGRFGQTLTRMLRANHIQSTVLDIDSEQIEVISRFGQRAFFGDGSNVDLLEAAGLDHCKALVIAVDQAETAIRIVENVKLRYPHLPIYSRAYDRIHAYQLLHMGVKEVGIETSGSAIQLATEILSRELGIRRPRAEHLANQFYTNNQRSIHDLSKRYHSDDRETFIQASREMVEQMEAMLKSDPTELRIGESSELKSH